MELISLDMIYYKFLLYLNDLENTCKIDFIADRNC